MKITVKKKVVGSQETGGLDVSAVCPYGGGWRGEYRVGNVGVLHNWKGDIDQIGLMIDYDNENGDDDDKWERVADVTLTRDQALALAELLIKSVKDADSLR